MSRERGPEVVVITGASGGVGRAAAVAFARRGARIGLLARGRGGLEGRCATSRRPAAGDSSSPPTSPTPTRSRRPDLSAIPRARG